MTLRSCCKAAVIALLLLSTGCDGAPSPNTSESTSTLADSTPTGDRVTLGELRSLTYSIDAGAGIDSVTLRDGRFADEIGGIKVDAFLVGADGKELTDAAA